MESNEKESHTFISICCVSISVNFVVVSVSLFSTNNHFVLISGVICPLLFHIEASKSDILFMDLILISLTCFREGLHLDGFCFMSLLENSILKQFEKHFSF